jgi:peptidoglycan-associated lipoprotein
MLKKIFFSLVILLMTLSLFTCGSAKKTQRIDTPTIALVVVSRPIVEFSEMKEQEGLTEEELMAKEEVVVKEEQNIEETVLSPEEESKSVFKDVLFDFDQYNIRENARPVLDTVSSFLNKNKELSIVIEGHCDERGTNEYNLMLGEKRAKTTKNYLVSLGVSQARMKIITYGEENPRCSQQNESCWQKNRRSSIKLPEHEKEKAHNSYKDINNENKLIEEAEDYYKDAYRTIYTIQTGSFINFLRAQKQFNSMIQGLNRKVIDNLRIEKVGKFYAVRLGKFEDSSAAEKFLQANKSQLSTAIILDAFIKDERIIKTYSYMRN